MTDAKLNGLADSRDRLSATGVPAVNSLHAIGVGKSYCIAAQARWYGGENIVLDLSSPALQVSTRMVLRAPHSAAPSLVEVDSGGTARIVAGDGARGTEHAGQVRGLLADYRWIMSSALPAGEVISHAAQPSYGDIAMVALPATMLVIYQVDLLGTVSTHGLILDDEQTCIVAPAPVEAARPGVAVSQFEWHRRIVDPDFFLHGAIDAAQDVVPDVLGDDNPVDEIVEDGGISAVRAQQLFLGKRTVSAPRADRPRDQIAPSDGSVDGPVEYLAADRLAALFRGIRRPK